MSQVPNPSVLQPVDYDEGSLHIAAGDANGIGRAGFELFKIDALMTGFEYIDDEIEPVTYRCLK